MFVSGVAPEQTNSPAMRSGYINPRIDPAYYSDADNLGFSFKSIAKAVKKVASPVQKLAGKVTKPVLKVAGKVAAPLTSIGAGILRNVPGGGLLVGAVSGVKNLVTGNKAAGTIQRFASKTLPAVTATPFTYGPESKAMPTVQVTRPSIGTQLQRFKADPAGTIMRAGARLNRQAQGVAGKVATTADKAAAVASAAEAAGEAGDTLGARRLAQTARRLAELARAGQDTAQNVASAIQTGGAAAEGAATGAVAGAAADQAGQGIAGFLSTTTGKVTAGAAVVGLGLLLTRGGARGGSVQQWH